MNHTHLPNNQLFNTCKADNLKILHQSIRGISHKSDEFLISLSLTSPHVFGQTKV
jgi:hypothetical protein